MEQDEENEEEINSASVSKSAENIPEELDDGEALGQSSPDKIKSERKKSPSKIVEESS